MNLPFLSKSSQAITSWPWPSCGTPKTLSFRSTGTIPKSVNAADHIDANILDMAQCQGHSNLESYFSATCSNTLKPELDSIWFEGAVEEVISGLRSDDRLFFDPGETRSILDKAKSKSSPFEESVAMVMDSCDPYIDFKKSMNEMVEAHELRDWENLEELLNWYLRVNEENTHGYIIGAFVDLLVELSFSLGSSNDDEIHGETSSTNSAHDFISSPLSFSFSTNSTSPCLSTLELVENDIEKEVDSGS